MTHLSMDFQSDVVIQYNNHKANHNDISLYHYIAHVAYFTHSNLEGPKVLLLL